MYVRTRVPTRVETTAYRRPGFQEDGERGEGGGRRRTRRDGDEMRGARRGAFRDGRRRRGRRRKRGPTTIRLERRAFPLPANSPRRIRDSPRISLVFRKFLRFFPALPSPRDSPPPRNGGIYINSWDANYFQIERDLVRGGTSICKCVNA